MKRIAVWITICGMLLLVVACSQQTTSNSSTNAVVTTQSLSPADAAQQTASTDTTAPTEDSQSDEPATDAAIQAATELPGATATEEPLTVEETVEIQPPVAEITTTTVIEPTPTRSPQETTITLARATWDTGWFQAAIYQQLLERMGYNVNGPQTMDNETFYLLVAEGKVDMWPNGWFPLHNAFLGSDRQQSHVEVIGSELRGGALQGYLIDKQTADEQEITSLGDLQDPQIAALFDSDGDGKANLIGCEPGLGCHKVIEHQLDAYALRDTVEHTYGDYSRLMLKTIERYEAGEPVLFYTWTPNWTIGELVPGNDVVWIEVPFPSLPVEQREQEDQTELEAVVGCVNDPCQLGFPPNDIRVVANSEFLEENPKIRRLLELVEIPRSDIALQNARMFLEGEQSDADIERHAREWIERNANLVDFWVNEATPFTGGGMVQRVKAREQLLCGVDANFKGFSIYNEETDTYDGFNADFCRVIATAIFGDPTAVEFVPLEFQESFQTISDRKVDVLLNNTTWTAVRDAGMDPPNSGISLTFGPTIFHDGQRFMVRTASEIGGIDQITPEKVNTICVQEGTTSEQNIIDRFGATRIGIKPYEDVDRVYRMYEQGICDAVTADTTELTARLLDMENPAEHTILPIPISREPLGAVVIEGDDEWADVVNWAIFATMYAEELGVNSTNVETLRQESTNPDIRRLLGVRGDIGKKLGLDNDFAYNIVRELGNYGEIYNRNLGPGTALNIQRGPNKIWNEGGVLSSPPFR
jgi:glycine betaine/proline transport system substrate-binding protein